MEQKHTTQRKKMKDIIWGSNLFFRFNQNKLVGFQIVYFFLKFYNNFVMAL